MEPILTHSWNLDEARALQLQQEFASKVIRQDRLIRCVAAYQSQSRSTGPQGVDRRQTMTQKGMILLFPLIASDHRWKFFLRTAPFY